MNALLFCKRFALVLIVVAGIYLPSGELQAQISGVCVMPFVPPGVPENKPDPRCNIECKTCNCSPVFAATGNYTTGATDLQLPTNGFPLEMSRRYDSVRFADGLSGVGWNSTPMTRLYYATYLFAAPDTYKRRAVITFPTGLSYDFDENTDGITFTPPPGRKDILIKNTGGTYTLTLERSRSKYEFSATGHLTSMTDEFGNALTVTYDASSRPQRIADASGSTRFIDFFYGADGRISAVQDHTGRTVQYLYDSLGYLTTVTDPMARNTRYEYVQSRFRKKLSRIADHWNREITAMTYASTGRLNSYTEQGMLYTFTYFGSTDSFKRDALGNEWRFFYGAGGVVTNRYFPGGGQQRNDIDADGRTIFFIDEVGAQTRTSYLSDGRVAVVEKGTGANPRIQHFYYTYDATFPDKVAAIRPMNFDATAPDRTWQEWKYDYYPPGSPAPGALHHVYRVLTDGTQQTMTTYVYDNKGRVSSTTDAAGSATDCRRP